MAKKANVRTAADRAARGDRARQRAATKRKAGRRRPARAVVAEQYKAKPRRGVFAAVLGESRALAPGEPVLPGLDVTEAPPAPAGRKGPQGARSPKTARAARPGGQKSAPTRRAVAAATVPERSPAEIRARASALAGTEPCRCECGQDVPQEGGGAARRYYVNEHHAYRAYVKRNGWSSDFLTKLDAQTIEKQAARAARPKPVPPVRTSPREGDAADHLALRYGPIREVTKILETRERSKRVLLDCTHEVTLALGVKTARCRFCRQSAA